MNLKQLEYFVAAASEKSISKAAKSLHVAQPPLSRQLALLEDELDVDLFIRTNKGIDLTDAGTHLLLQSQALLQTVKSMVDSVRDVSAGMKGTLKVGIIYSNSPVVMSHLKEYHEKYPQVEFYFRLGAPKDLMEDLNSGELHVLFLRSSNDNPTDTNVKILGEESIELVMSSELDPAPHLPEIPLEALKDVPLCLVRNDDLWGYSSRLISDCQRLGFAPRIVCQTYSTPMTLQLIQAGFGISYLPASILGSNPDSGLYTKPIKGIREKSYPSLIWRNDAFYGDLVKQFIDMF